MNMNRIEKKRLKICYDCHEPVSLNRSRCSFHLRGNTKSVASYHKTDKGIPNKKRRDAKCKQRVRRTFGRFSYVKSHAIRKGKTWTITKDQYEAIILNPCEYCKLPNNVGAGVGLDRLNNGIGYEIGNIVSCCSLCNYTRGDRLTPDEMREVGKIIAKIRIRRNSSRSVIP